MRPSLKYWRIENKKFGRLDSWIQFFLHSMVTIKETKMKRGSANAGHVVSMALRTGLALLSLFLFERSIWNRTWYRLWSKHFIRVSFLYCLIMFHTVCARNRTISLNTDLANAFYGLHCLRNSSVVHTHLCHLSACSIRWSRMMGLFTELQSPLDSLQWRIFCTCWPTRWNMLFSGPFSCIQSRFVQVWSVGYYLGKAKFSASNNKVYLSLALIIPISLHGVYDYILVSQKKILGLLYHAIHDLSMVARHEKK